VIGIRRLNSHFSSDGRRRERRGKVREHESMHQKEMKHKRKKGEELGLRIHEREREQKRVKEKWQRRKGKKRNE